MTTPEQTLCPKPLLIRLFNQLGLNGQAKNIEKSDIKNQITYLETYILLKKHHVGLMVQAIDKHQLINTIHPFLLLPEQGEPLIARRSNHQFQYLAYGIGCVLLRKPSPSQPFHWRRIPSNS